MPSQLGTLAAIARKARIAPPGLFYHVMNRTAGKFLMHRNEQDFAAFERILIEAHQRGKQRGKQDAIEWH